MDGTDVRALLFLDVDGTVLPFGGGADAGIGARLTALGCETVWATTWDRDEANEVVAPRVGLPELAAVEWEEAEEGDSAEDAWFGLHWKTRTLVRRAAGRTFVWIDDEITEADRDWVAAHHPGRALLCRVDGGRGLREADLPAVGEWLREGEGDRSP